MLRLRLKVLGGFEARIGPGEPLDIATRKTRALLAYLALPPGRAHVRDKLTGLLWSDRGDEQARNSLRQALTELGRILTDIEPSPLVKGRDTLSLDPEAVEVDATSLRIVRIVVRKGFLFGAETSIPAAMIATVGDSIRLRARADAAKKLERA